MTEQMFRDMFETKAKYHEILVLEVKLYEAKIPHTFNTYMGGWRIAYPNNEKTICSAIEHNGSYGREDDKIEIMGLLTEEESKCDGVVGWLTAEDVFNRIKKHYEEHKNVDL